MSEAEPEASEEAPDGPTPPSPPASQAPWFRFALVFGVMAVGSEILYYTVALESQGFKAYLSGIASISGWFLALFDSGVVVSDARIDNGKFAVLIAQGCDAIQVCTLLASAVIAFPLSLRAKLRGLVVGIGILQLLNLARVITLFWIGEYFSSVFPTAHEIVWPGFLIVATILIWILWVRFETEDHPAADDAA